MEHTQKKPEQNDTPKNYIGEGEITGRVYKTVVIDLPKYQTNYAYKVTAHVEYSQQPNNTIFVQVWSVINHPHYRWHVIEFAIAVDPEIVESDEHIINTIMNYLNEDDDFHQGILRNINKYGAWMYLPEDKRFDTPTA